MGEIEAQQLFCSPVSKSLHWLPHLARQVEEKLDEFDATRSSGHLCAATADNFEQVDLSLHPSS